MKQKGLGIGRKQAEEIVDKLILKHKPDRQALDDAVMDLNEDHPLVFNDWMLRDKRSIFTESVYGKREKYYGWQAKQADTSRQEVDGEQASTSWRLDASDTTEADQGQVITVQTRIKFDEPLTTAGQLKQALAQFNADTPLRLEVTVGGKIKAIRSETTTEGSSNT